MKERGIPFNDAMVRAIEEGRKTQTRRPVKPQPTEHPGSGGRWIDWGNRLFKVKPERLLPFGPYGVPGDLLWVREAWALPPDYDPARHGDLRSRPSIGPVCYRADYPSWPPWNGSTWRPSIHMPRWASRRSLLVTNVRVERVRDIKHRDAVAEGLWGIDSFRSVWHSLYATKGLGWDENPWVWCYTFEKVEA